MKKSPKKSPAKQKSKLTDYDMEAGVDHFFDNKNPGSPQKDKSQISEDESQSSSLTKKSVGKPKLSSPSKSKKDKNLSSQIQNSSQKKEVVKLDKKQVATTEPSTAQGTCETISASKSKQDKNIDSSQDTGATALFKQKQEGGGSKTRMKKVIQSEDEEEEKKSAESEEKIKKRDKKSTSKNKGQNSPKRDKFEDDEPDQIQRSLRDRGNLKRLHKDQTQQSSLVDPTQKDDDDYEDEQKDKSKKSKSKSKEISKPQKASQRKNEIDQDPVSEEQESNDELDGDDDEFKEDPLNELMPLDDLDENEGDEEEAFLPRSAPQKKTRKKKVKSETGVVEKEESAEEENEDDNDDNVFIDNLPKDENSIRVLLKEVNRAIRELEKQFFEEEDSEADEELKHDLEREGITPDEHNLQLDKLKEKSHIQHFWSIPISENVIELDFDKLAAAQMKNGGRLFDVITCDPPWQLSSANPTRGVAIAYSTLSDNQILNIPLNKIQTNGFLFIWVINNKYRFALDMFEKYKYRLVDEIAWVKQTVNGKIAKGHGFYLQHAKETCLVGVKGDIRDKAYFNIMSDVIFSQRRGQSQKPEEIYDLAESLVPDGYYLEIFARRNNLHNGWMSIGNEL